MVTNEDYKEAIELAELFIKKANLVLAEENVYYSKNNASARRISMELSNALVKIRK